MSIKNKLISNTTYLFLDWFFGSILSMLYWLIIGKTLNPYSYGIIATSIQIVVILSAISMLGLDSTTRKLIPELVKRKDKKKIYGLIAYSTKIIFFASMIIALTFIILASQISSLLKLETKVLCVAAISVITVSLANSLGCVHYGFQNMRKNFITDFYGQLTKLILTFLLILLGFYYFGPLIAFSVCYLVIILTRIKKEFFFNKKTIIDKKHIFKYSIPAFIVGILLVLLNYTQYIILALLSAYNTMPAKMMETIGFFAIAMTISFPIQIIPNILSSALFPITSELSANKNGKSRQTYLIKLVFRYSLFFVLPVAIFLIVFSKYAILFFAKPEYLPATVVLPLLVLAQALFGLGCLFLTSLYALGKPNKYRDCFAIITLIYFLLAIPLTYYFSEKGLAVSYLFATLLSFILGFYILKKYLDIKLPINDIGKIIVAVFVSSIFLLLFRPLIYNFWLAGIFVATATLIYLLILLKLNFYLEEDLKVLNFVGDKSPIFKKQIIKLRNYLSKFVNRSYHDF